MHVAHVEESVLGVLIAFTYWRTRPGFLRHPFATNTLLMAGGFTLLGYQLVGYVVTQCSTHLSPHPPAAS
jgi:hypothetical protein